MTTEILRIIEGGLSNDKRKIISYSNKLAQKLEQEGDSMMAKCILDKINSTPISNATADSMRLIPVDGDSRLQIVEVIPEGDVRTNVILDDYILKQITEFIELVKHQQELELAGIDMPKTLLLYGQPGCGKTSLAHYISEHTRLPLVVAKLDGIVSSLLGSTAKNLRKIFEYAQGMPCILFLDEFDAIAKARDDSHELGELKRVINSLLQNIDSMPSSCVLIAATNHPELLDNAVWRRFVTAIEIGLPDKDGMKELIETFIGNFECELMNDSNKMDQFIEAASGKTPAELKNIFDKLKVRCVIEGRKNLDFDQLLSSLYYMSRNNTSKDGLVRYLNQNGVSQTQISKSVNISLRQVRNALSDK